MAAQLQRALSRVRAEVAEQQGQVEVLERSLAAREEEVEAEVRAVPLCLAKPPLPVSSFLCQPRSRCSSSASER